jgi:hypothetical protein
MTRPDIAWSQLRSLHRDKSSGTHLEQTSNSFHVLLEEKTFRSPMKHGTLQRVALIHLRCPYSPQACAHGVAGPCIYLSTPGHMRPTPEDGFISMPSRKVSHVKVQAILHNSRKIAHEILRDIRNFPRISFVTGVSSTLKGGSYIGLVTKARQSSRSRQVRYRQRTWKGHFDIVDMVRCWNHTRHWRNAPGNKGDSFG